MDTLGIDNLYDLAVPSAEFEGSFWPEKKQLALGIWQLALS
jgi:hypothetical protein